MACFIILSYPSHGCTEESHERYKISGYVGMDWVVLVQGKFDQLSDYQLIKKNLLLLTNE